MQTAVHQLWPPPGDLRKTEMNILFFHGYPRDPDEWKSAWTQRSHPDVCWPEKWLPADLGFDVRVLFVSYGQSRVADVVDDLFKALVIRDEWDLCKNLQPLVLVGRGGFGALVLDKFFLKATEELLTSPTEAGAFVRNVRGVTLYGDDQRYTKSYEIVKFFGGKFEDFERKLEDRTRAAFSMPTLRNVLFITQGSMLINPAIYGKNLTRDVVGMDPCQWIKEDIREDWNNEVSWKPENKQSRGYNLLLESCRMVYQFEGIRATLEHLQQKLDNITTACDISSYSDSMFENEFTYLRHNGIEGAKILIVQRMLVTKGVDVEQHMVVKKSDDGEQLENAILKFTVAKFCENHEWHMVPEMRESDMQQKIESILNDVVDGIPPLSDDIMNEKMHRESMDHPGRQAFRRDGNDTVPIQFPSIREQSIVCVKQLQQLACNMRRGKSLRQEDVQEQLKSHMAQALDGGKLIVTGNILEGKIQFLFGNAKSMAQIVGVGLDFATVSLTRQNVIVVKGITESEWTRLWGKVFLGESLFENPIFMEKVVISPPDHEEPQGSHVNALSTVAMFFMIKKCLQNVDVGKVYNQVVRGVATTMTGENQSDIGQVHAKSVNDPSTGILGFNLSDYSNLQITRGLGSATRGTSGERPSHVGGTDIPSEEDKNQAGDGGEDGDNREGRWPKGEEIQQNNQQDVRVIVEPGSDHASWDGDVDPTPEQLIGSYITPTLTFLFKKTENTIESEVLVKCCMNNESGCQDSKRFGWFQNELDVWFQCLEPNASRPSLSELLGTQDLRDTFMEQREATSSQATYGANVGLHGTSASASYTTPSTLQLIQTNREMPSVSISGIRCSTRRFDRGGATPLLGYNFKLWREVSTNKLPDGFDEEKYNGTLCTISPNFKANWRVMREHVICKYELKVKRETSDLLVELKKWKRKPLCTCKKMWQTYMVTLYINHNMSNIATLAKSERLINETNPKNKLVGLSVHPTSLAFGEASSSTQ